MPIYNMTSNIKKWEADGKKAVKAISSADVMNKVTSAWTKQMRMFVKEDFLSEGDKQWPELSPRYAAWKGTRGRGILRLTDKMFRSLKGKTGESIIEKKKTGTGFDYTYGTKNKKAELHHFGNKKLRLPIRKVIVVDKPEKTELQKTMGEIMTKKLASMPFFDKSSAPLFTVRGVGRGKGVQRF